MMTGLFPVWNDPLDGCQEYTDARFLFEIHRFRFPITKSMAEPLNEYKYISKEEDEVIFNYKHVVRQKLSIKTVNTDVRKEIDG